MVEQIILISFIKKILLKLNKFLFLSIKNKRTKLIHEEIVVAIGIIINPTSLKK